MPSPLNLAIDHGNTRSKAATFSGRSLVKEFSFSSSNDLNDFLKRNAYSSIIISSVKKDTDDLNLALSAQRIFYLTYQLPLPIKLLYHTPQTLGVDRLAAACGAKDIFPHKHCLVIDIGTCINYEFIDDVGNYYGGAISPGLRLRFESMHQFTGQLPLAGPVDESNLIGMTTEECLQSGVMNGATAEIEGMIAFHKKKYPSIEVILCGGDSHFFEKKIKGPIFVAPNLVLKGLNSILLSNVVNL